jgi:hypothetical protein
MVLPIIAFFIAILSIPAIIIFVAIKFFGRRNADKKFEENMPRIFGDD